MRMEIAIPERFKLYIPDLDNHILVENHGGGGVVIHASRDNVSDRRKAAFVRHLAREGYIPDQYEWFCEPRAEELFGVRWVVDRSWSESDPRIERRAWRRELGVTLLGLAVFAMLRWWVSPHAL
jgi:hypothetical protein